MDETKIDISDVEKNVFGGGSDNNKGDGGSKGKKRKPLTKSEYEALVKFRAYDRNMTQAVKMFN